nr:AraC family transcriptional regulator [uncultured Carboxylicivirga sp.]
MLKLNHYTPQKYKSLIERITIGKSTNKEFNLMFIPTHYLTLFIPLNNTDFYYDDVCYSKPVLKKILLKPAHLHIPKHSYLFGIRFYPFGAFPFSDFLKSENNYHIISEDNEIIEKVFTALETHYNQEKELQISVIKKFYNYLLENPESSSVNNFCEQKEFSYMPFYRSFQKYLDISPKKFERLIKFRLSVDHMIWKKQKLTNVSFDSGYYDQAHFIKEFKHFVGMTPSEYIKYLSDNNLYNYEEFANFTSLNM